MTDTLYPPAPAIADASFLQPSTAFKSRTYRMILGIVLFVLLYLLLIAFGIGLLITAAAAALFVLMSLRAFLGLVIALGLLCLGVMFFFFTIKFMFATTREEDPMEMEITEKDQPVLFDFIRKLSKEVGTDFPRKIFLTADVNASVSYNSSFWSMFLPVRKNLRIGLGLVNALNLSEFKATLAHEFGHFSQRSMKTGSYIYTANKIIFNLAYQYDRFDILLESWRGSGGLFGAFAFVTSFFVEGVRKILRSSYGVLNVTYLALSREMEYHADLVACSAAGNEAMINTLRKIEFADVAYQNSIGNLNTLGAKKQRKASDVYSLHVKIMNDIASFFKLETRNGLPVITAADLDRTFAKSRLVVKDQWASHPSREEREDSINRFNVQSPVVTESAWSLFTNVDALKSGMTSKLYGTGEFKDLPNATVSEIDEHLAEQKKRSTISPTFRGVFDNRWLTKFKIHDIDRISTMKTFEALINETNANNIKKHFRDQSDLEQLVAINEKQIKISFFEFDDVRYKAKDAEAVLTKLQEEVNRSRLDLEELDHNILRYYYQVAKEEGTAGEYLALLQSLETKTVDQEIVESFTARIQKFLYELQTKTQWSQVDMDDLCRSVNNLEKEVKRFMQQLPPETIESHFPEPQNVRKYVQTEQLWNHSFVNFSNEGFQQLHIYVVCCHAAISEQVWDATLAIYNKQLSLTPAHYRKD